jgi:hypothetical protein
MSQWKQAWAIENDGRRLRFASWLCRFHGISLAVRISGEIASIHDLIEQRPQITRTLHLVGQYLFLLHRRPARQRAMLWKIRLPFGYLANLLIFLRRNF